MTTKEKTEKYWPLALTVIFGLGTWLFWAMPFATTLAYQEQYQLFLSTWDYFATSIALPGGLATYVGEWLTQWSVWPVVGGLLIALVYVALQILTWLVAKRLGTAKENYALTFIPALFLWGCSLSGDILMAYPLSLIGALGLMLAYEAVRGKVVRRVLMFAGAIVGYWLLGPHVVVAVAYAIVREIARARSAVAVGFGVGLGLTLYVVVIGSSYVVDYSVSWLVNGIGYHRYPVHNELLHVIALMLTILTPLVMPLVKGGRAVVAVVEVGLVAAAGSAWLMVNYDEQEHDAYDYDYFVRTEQWDAAIEKAEKKQPTSSADRCAVNLALSMKGQLADRIFDFQQNGVAGLLSPFSRNMEAPVTPSEVYFRLGMINECERYAFEAQECIPTLAKSGRLTQRLAECEIVNGNYAVAHKLLTLLTKSPTYRAWAKERMPLINNDQAVDEHPLYGRLRQIRQRSRDFFSSEQDLEKMLGLLFMNNGSNRMAFDYLMCYVMLKCDQEKFARYFTMGKQIYPGRIPKAYQETLIGCWLKNHKNLNGFPYKADGFTSQNTLDCIRLHIKDKDDPRLSQPPYSNNAIHYILSKAGVEVKQH